MFQDEEKMVPAPTRRRSLIFDIVNGFFNRCRLMAIDGLAFAGQFDRKDLLRLNLHSRQAGVDLRICSFPVGDVDSQV